MRVIITGGSGFIGSALIEELTASGHEPIILSRNPERTGARFKGEAEAVFWDGRTANGWGQLAEGEAIVNLAGANIGAGRWTSKRKEVIRNSRVNAGQAVCDAVAKAEIKPKVLIQASAVGWYGPQGATPVDENSAGPGQGFLASVCRDWEASTREVEEAGVRRVVIRSGVVIDKDGGALEQIMKPFRFHAGGVIGHGRQGFPWIYRRDEVRAIRFLLEHKEHAGVYNLCAPALDSFRDFLIGLGRAMRSPAWFPVPGFALRAALGQMAEEMLLSGQFVRPSRLLESQFSFECESLNRLLEQLFK
ncbi:MAG: TIGR01777 family oxidoreductase [Desulfovibrio sp.]|uniref:TIGR01777 family oxidoreductase n=1 Tax=Desulfovibrio sp. 7SRBS1 TaxID=3378064 RepID=UPI003B4009FE